MSENEILRRVQDLLVGDVVAHNGRRRVVERVYRDRLSDLRGVETTCVIFEDSKEQMGRQGAYKAPERFETGVRLLLLESHYSAAAHANCRCSVTPAEAEGVDVQDKRTFRRPWGASFKTTASGADVAVKTELNAVPPEAIVHVVLQVVG